MAWIKAQDIAYGRLAAPDLDLTEEFLTRFGMIKVERTSTALYMRGTDPSHHIHVTEKGAPRFVGLAYRAASEHDFALVLVDGNSPTGTMPYALDWKGKVKIAVRVGYAGDILDGEIVQQAEGIVFFANSIPMFPESPPNLVVHWQSVTDLNQGTSGGGWITNFSTEEASGKNVLVAVTSFNDEDYPGAVMGAYLTAAEFNPLLAYVSNGCK